MASTSWTAKWWVVNKGNMPPTNCGHIVGRRSLSVRARKSRIMEYNLVETNMVLMKWQVTFERIYFLPMPSMEFACACNATSDAVGPLLGFLWNANKNGSILLVRYDESSCVLLGTCIGIISRARRPCSLLIVAFLILFELFNWKKNVQKSAV